MAKNTPGCKFLKHRSHGIEYTRGAPRVQIVHMNPALGAYNQWGNHVLFCFG